ncbi:MAG: dTMP kinase [Firmicutes bacterium]|nr:dTMP kinase [Bacillota bacterium]
MRRKGKLITFEGPDGAGKTTQVNLTAAALRAGGYSVLATREPGGTRLSEAVRGLLLDPSFREMTPAAEALLYAGARAQLVREVLIPALAAGTIVLCDRFVDSSLAYQGYGRGLDLDLLRTINAFALNGLGPFYTILLDLEPELGLRRSRGRHAGDRLEHEDISFHHRVREGYRILARTAPGRIKVVDARGAPEEVQARLWKLVSLYLEDREPGAPF